jgi:4-hydroxybenzoate polyprenyltransferase
MNRVFAHVVLMRPANIITAVADILLGFAASGAVGRLHAEAGAVPLGHPQLRALYWLVAATVGLYGGGVVLNDVFDADLDQVERPERPIPSGAASRRSAGLLGTGLLLGGIGAAAQASATSAWLAAAIAGLAVLYDARGKHHPLLGPLNMGACRGGNLLLGLSAVPGSPAQLWYLALIPVVYIAAITAVSRGEVNGGDKRVLLLSVGLYTLVISSVLGLLRLPQAHAWYALPFLLLFAAMIFPPLLKALRSLRPPDVRQAVRAGVLALILLDATVAAGFAGWWYGLLVLALLPLSRWLAGRFAVT